MSNNAKKPAHSRSKAIVDGDTVRMAVIFLAAVAALESILYALDGAGVLVPLQEATARISAWLIAVVGLDAVQSGIDILLADHTLRITLDCTAAFVIAAHAALVIAYPTTLGRRLVGFVTGVAALIVANFARLVLVAIVAVRFPDTLDIVHDYLFHVALVLVTAVVWIVWISWVRRDA